MCVLYRYIVTSSVLSVSALEFMGFNSSTFYYSCTIYLVSVHNFLLCRVLTFYFIFSAAFITLCWPHIARTALSKIRGKFNNLGYEESAQRGIFCIHASCRSRKQDDMLTVTMYHRDDAEMDQ
jgi:hypothetical protein